MAAALHMRKQSLWAIRQPVPRGTALALAFIMPVLVLGAWCVVSYGHLAPPDFVPSPTEVVRGTLQLFLQYDLATAILVSTKRIVLSFRGGWKLSGSPRMPSLRTASRNWRSGNPDHKNRPRACPIPSLRRRIRQKRIKPCSRRHPHATKALP